MILIYVLACLACVVAVAAAMLWAATFLLGPGVLYLSQRLEARATIVPTPIEAFPPCVRRWASAHAEALSCRGFEPHASVLLPHYVPGLAAYLVLMRNPETGERATISAIFSRDAQASLKARYVEFSTRLSNGVSIETLNPPALSFTEWEADSVKTWLPDVVDPRLLYRMHRHICASSAKGGVPVSEEQEEGAAYLSRVLTEECEEQQKRGLLILDSERAMFHPTYKGACWNCWSQLWPIAPLRRAQARSRASQRLAGFNIEVISGRKPWKAGFEAEDEADVSGAGAE